MSVISVMLIYVYIIISCNFFFQAHPRVAQKLKFIIKSWADMKEFKEDPALK
jgi:hypothetical protein